MRDEVLARSRGAGGDGLEAMTFRAEMVGDVAHERDRGTSAWVRSSIALWLSTDSFGDAPGEANTRSFEVFGHTVRARKP